MLQIALSFVPERLRCRFKRIEKAGFGKLRDNDWRFAFGSSGTFGVTLPGHWLDYDQALAMWRAINSIYVRHPKRIGEWYDIHAMT